MQLIPKFFINNSLKKGNLKNLSEIIITQNILGLEQCKIQALLLTKTLLESFLHKNMTIYSYIQNKARHRKSDKQKKIK